MLMDDEKIKSERKKASQHRKKFNGVGSSCVGNSSRYGGFGSDSNIGAHRIGLIKYNITFLLLSLKCII